MDGVKDVQDVRRRRLIAGAAALVAGMAVAHPTQRVAATTTDSNYIAEGGVGTGFRCNTGVYEYGGVLTGTVAGVLGQSYSATTDSAGAGVRGESTSGAGVYGQSDSFYGVYGKSFGTRGAGYDAGVLGVADVDNANAIAVQGNVTGSAGIGVLGGRRNTGGAFNGVGVKGFSDGGYGVQGDAATGRGVFGSSDSGYGVYGSSANGYGVYGSSGRNVYAGVYGANSAGSGTGVLGEGKNGVFGNTTGTTLNSFGVVAYGNGGPTIAMFANNSGQAILAQTLGTAANCIVGTTTGTGSGVYGSSGSGFGLYGTTLTGYAIVGYAPAGSAAALYGSSSGVNTPAFAAFNAVAGGLAGTFNGKVYINGDYVATGTKSAAVPHPDGTHRLLYCMESPEAWFEDFGTGTITGGKAEVKLDADFAAVVDAKELHVFCMPHDEHHALHIAGKSATGFTVGAVPSTTGATAGKKAGDLSGTFTYRVVAKRKDVAAPRLAKYDLPKIPTPPPIPPTPDTPAVPTPKK